MALLLGFSVLACLLPASLWSRVMFAVSTLHPHGASLLVPFSLYAAAPQQPHLVVVIPFISADIPRLTEGIRKWAALGPVCNWRQEDVQRRVALRFYHSQSAAAYELERSAYIERWMRLERVIAENVLPCFDSVHTMFAELTPAQDGYPEGPSNMFFKLMLDHSHSLLRSFSHVYWMEWDVRVVRRHFVDALYGITVQGGFWMKGSRYGGGGFDDIIQDRSSWDWVGHLNGNALYKLHDPQFERFLELVMEREPPSAFWKPFDVAIWKTLHDFPYSWHLYQKYGGQFQTTTIVQHVGFQGRPGEAAQLVAADPTVHLVHGDGESAGKAKWYAKFGAGANTDKMGKGDVIDSSLLRISVFVRSAAEDLPFATAALLSAKRYMPGALEYVIVVPVQDYAKAKAELPEFVTLQPELELLHSQVVQRKLTTLSADRYCRGAFIFHLEADVVLFRPVLKRDLFIYHKPIVTLDTWSNGSSLTVGNGVDLDFSRSANRVYPRSVYAAARQHAEAQHNESFQQFLSHRENELRNRKDISANEADKALNEFNYLGAYIYLHHPDVVSWAYVGHESPPQHSLPYAYTPVCPTFSYHGQARLRNDRQLAILSSIAAGHHSDCNELQ
jgi:hypothetical protein